MLKTLRRSTVTRSTARRLCSELLHQARAPVFFLRLKVPDTIDGRFDLVALHAWLVLEWVGSDQRLSQALINEVFRSFEEALRHLGTGDAGINRRLKTLASAFYGRLSAYQAATTPTELSEAIWRNVYRGSDSCRAYAERLARYVAASRSELAKTELSAGRLKFAPLPTM
ncbi:MAG: ubiquinol-cytochrome C chaperone family protein [Alphaproteobacteria bacterium]|nr:ubiquinol-cytochrome C chaperone family protein [Alphaproteobacteria bacterium]